VEGWTDPLGRRKAMSTMKLNQKVSHQDVQKAVQQFLKNGGIIVRLPEQKPQPKPVVGGEKYQDYEPYTALFPTS
jgi:hypothetical protein